MSSEYLNSISPGEHKLVIVYSNDLIAFTAFTVNDKIENPKTGIINYFGLISIFPILLVMINILKNFKKLHEI